MGDLKRIEPMPYGVIIEADNGKRYQPTQTYEIEYGSDGMLIRPLYSQGSPMMEPHNRCECCGRSDWRPVLYGSFEEAIEAGLFVLVTDG